MEGEWMMKDDFERIDRQAAELARLRAELAECQSVNQGLEVELAEMRERLDEGVELVAAMEAGDIDRQAAELARLRAELARVRGERDRLFAAGCATDVIERSTTDAEAIRHQLHVLRSGFVVIPSIAAALAEHDRRFGP